MISLSSGPTDGAVVPPAVGFSTAAACAGFTEGGVLSEAVGMACVSSAPVLRVAPDSVVTAAPEDEVTDGAGAGADGGGVATGACCGASVFKSSVVCFGGSSPPAPCSAFLFFILSLAA